MPGPRDVQPTDQEAPTHLTEREFKEWLANKQDALAAKAEEQAAKREADIVAGRIPIEQLTGKELADHHPGTLSVHLLYLSPLYTHSLNQSSVDLFLSVQAEVFQGY